MVTNSLHFDHRERYIVAESRSVFAPMPHVVDDRASQFRAGFRRILRDHGVKTFVAEERPALVGRFEHAVGVDEQAIPTFNAHGS